MDMVATSETELAKQLEHFLRPTFELLVKYRMSASLNSKDRRTLSATLAHLAWPLRESSASEIHAKVRAALNDPSQTPGPIADAIRAKGPKSVVMVAANVVGRIKER
jgi:hypothetical protein